jgi:hypothetical protein
MLQNLRNRLRTNNWPGNERACAKRTEKAALTHAEKIAKSEAMGRARVSLGRNSDGSPRAPASRGALA